jgi:flagellar hook-length control protein FliK
MLLIRDTSIMPELLLSSAPIKNLSPNVEGNSSDRSMGVSAVGMPNAVKGSASAEKQENKFNNILSSVVNQPAPDNTDKTTENELTELSSVIEDLLSGLTKLDPDSKMLSDIKSFVDGQDISTLSMENINDGLSLPDFLVSLESMINSMLNKVDEHSGMSLSESFSEEIAAIESMLLQLNTLINKTTIETKDHGQVSSGSLLGFSFDAGKGKSGQWQQYDPQQMSQSGNTVSGSIISANSQDKSLVPNQLVPESDKDFQIQMEQLVSGKIQDTSDLVDKFSDAMIDVKDKATSRLSDIQLRTPNEAVKQYSTTLSTPVNSEQWNDEVSQKILWFASRNIQTAEMHLNPAELGPIDVKVHVQNDVTTVTFNVNNASVRDLLESNVVRLREMMEANGVNLGDVNVDSGSRDQSQQSGTDSNNKGSGQSGQEMDENGELVATENVVTLKQSNLVDYFV